GGSRFDGNGGSALRGNQQTFIWKADSIYHSEVPIAKFAPKGFDAQGRSMFVAPNEYEYGG
ncbi:CzcE family metal-binding protein, partial [Delftia tsuruhatensis]|uniref:CzcE family metal-binding protein n=1 Tax=Delftia tsuruhatensis TaxID=180282 RepID=UPI00202784DC